MARMIDPILAQKKKIDPIQKNVCIWIISVVLQIPFDLICSDFFSLPIQKVKPPRHKASNK